MVYVCDHQVQCTFAITRYGVRLRSPGMVYVCDHQVWCTFAITFTVFPTSANASLTPQNSMSKIKQQALEDHSKSLSNIAEPSNKTRIFVKRGMDDVYPQTFKKSRKQSLPRVGALFSIINCLLFISYISIL